MFSCHRLISLVGGVSRETLCARLATLAKAWMWSALSALGTELELLKNHSHLEMRVISDHEMRSGRTWGVGTEGSLRTDGGVIVCWFFSVPFGAARLD